MLRLTAAATPRRSVSLDRLRPERLWYQEKLWTDDLGDCTEELLQVSQPVHGTLRVAACPFDIAFDRSWERVGRIGSVVALDLQPLTHKPDGYGGEMEKRVS